MLILSDELVLTNQNARIWKSSFPWNSALSPVRYTYRSYNWLHHCMVCRRRSITLPSGALCMRVSSSICYWKKRQTSWEGRRRLIMYICLWEEVVILFEVNVYNRWWSNSWGVLRYVRKIAAKRKNCDEIKSPCTFFFLVKLKSFSWFFNSDLWAKETVE